MTIDFEGESAARLSFSKDGKFVNKALKPQDFTGDLPSPQQGLADMWWGGLSQNGWGIAILEQFGNLFSVWFTYDEDGKPTWFVMPGGEWKDSTTFSGTIYRTSGSAWLERPYDASQLRVGAVGTYSFRFATKDRATFEHSVDGRSGAADITRQSLD